MFKSALLLFILLYSTHLSGFSMKDRLINGNSGDYFVVKSGKMASIIRIASLEAERITLEEISAPMSVLKKGDWQDWINQKAPGHTSWVLYEIDLNTNELLECFSFSKRSFLQLEENHFLLMLLKTPLKPIPNESRKKIGPIPEKGELDVRANWQPPKIVQGKKISNPKFLALQATWPIDHSELSGKTIQLYFDESSEFFFPFWAEILSDHLTLPLKVLDCGKDLQSCIQSMPRRSLQFLAPPKKTKQEISFYINCPKYYNQVQLFAVDRSKNIKKIIEIPTQSNKKEQEKLELKVSIEELSTLLEKNHSYSWIIKPKGSQLISELEEPFYFD